MKKNSQDLYIIGAGGLAREVWLLVQAVNSRGTLFEVRGFIDSQPKEKSISLGGQDLPVFDESGFLKTYGSNKSEINLAIGIGTPAIVKKMSQTFSGFKFPNLIHPNNFGDFSGLPPESGNIIAAGCSFTLGISMGCFNYFNLNCTVGHDCVFGSCNVINPGTNISGGVQVGSENLIGTGATILQYLKIGSGSTLGAGAVLTKDLASGVLAVGVPAKVVNNT